MPAPKALASVTELGDWIGEPIPAGSQEFKRAEFCLRAASALVRDAAGQTWLADSGDLGDVPEAAVMVTLYCAGRVFDNRNAQTTGGLDDWSEGWKVDEAGAYLTASERSQLSALKPGRAHGGLGTVATTRLSRDPVTGWVPTPTPDVFFPWY